eukprot:g5709.t1
MAEKASNAAEAAEGLLSAKDDEEGDAAGGTQPPPDSQNDLVSKDEYPATGLAEEEDEGDEIGSLTQAPPPVPVVLITRGGHPEVEWFAGDGEQTVLFKREPEGEAAGGSPPAGTVYVPHRSTSTIHATLTISAEGGLTIKARDRDDHASLLWVTAWDDDEWSPGDRCPKGTQVDPGKTKVLRAGSHLIMGGNQNESDEVRRAADHIFYVEECHYSHTRGKRSAEATKRRQLQKATKSAASAPASQVLLPPDATPEQKRRMIAEHTIEVMHKAALDAAQAQIDESVRDQMVKDAWREKYDKMAALDSLDRRKQQKRGREQQAAQSQHRSRVNEAKRLRQQQPRPPHIARIGDLDADGREVCCHFNNRGSCKFGSRCRYSHCRPARWQW